MNYRVSINIVMWNSAVDLPQCLEALSLQTFSDFEIIIVDNNSEDTSLEIIEEYMPYATIIKNQTNVGFCKAHNQAITLSNSDFVLPLNPDVVIAPTFLEELVNTLIEYQDAGIAVGKTYLPGDELLIDGAGLFMNKARRQFLRGHGKKDTGQFNIKEYVFGADGSAPLYRRTMLEEIKIGNEYFDEDFISHKEDFDLSWRAQLFGWKCVYTSSALAFHDRSFRPSSRSEMLAEVKLHAVKNRYLAILKNEQLSNLMIHLPWVLSYDVKILAYLLFFERSSFVGILQFIQLLPSTFKKRQYIMMHKRVNASYIRALIK